MTELARARARPTDLPDLRAISDRTPAAALPPKTFIWIGSDGGRRSADLPSFSPVRIISATHRRKLIPCSPGSIRAASPRLGRCARTAPPIPRPRRAQPSRPSSTPFATCPRSSGTPAMVSANIGNIRPGRGRSASASRARFGDARAAGQGSAGTLGLAARSRFSAALSASAGGAQRKPKLTVPALVSTAWWSRWAWTIRFM